MRTIMTIPSLVMLASLIGWLLFAKVPKIADPWAADVCKCVFFAAVLVVLYMSAGKVAF